jgi:hypothetical protein
VLAEKLNVLNRVAAVAVRLGSSVVLCLDSRAVHPLVETDDDARLLDILPVAELAPPWLRTAAALSLARHGAVRVHDSLLLASIMDRFSSVVTALSCSPALGEYSRAYTAQRRRRPAPDLAQLCPRLST